MGSITDNMLKGDFDRILFSEMFVRLMTDGHDFDLLRHYVFLLIFNSPHLSMVNNTVFYHVGPLRTISDSIQFFAL